jgi:O-acetyl-ADP-ribose deacetylase (regulator of RNase III)
MIRVVQGDIAAFKVDAIVNAANSALLGGGGVDGAIHRAAGPELKAYCIKLGGCPTGEAKITPGFKLPAKYVIHTVGPVWHGGKSNESATATSLSRGPRLDPIGESTLLANCYRNSLELALKNGVKTIAFPSISTGAYGYPKEEAAKIAVAVMREYEKKFDEIVACCFSAGDKALYDKQLALE